MNESLPRVAKNYSKIAEEKFQTMIAEVEDYAILLLDTEGTIISWNKGAERIKGYAASEIIGKSYQLFYPPEDVARGLPRTLLKLAVDTGKANHEGWRIKKNGTRFWGSVTITALHDDHGGITGFLKLTRDLTEKKIVEDRYNNMLEELREKNLELKQEEQRYHKMVSEVRDYAIILLDNDGKILDWNKGAEMLKGYKHSEIVGKNFRLFYPNEDKETNLPQRLLDEAKLLGSVIHEGYRVRKDGSRFWGSVTITALHDDDGNLVGFSKMTKDLTDRKAAADKAAVFAQELKLKNEELRRSEERYHKMISEVQDYAILLLDKHGNIQNWNAGAELIKGYSPDEIIGKNFSVFYTPEDVAQNLPNKLLAAAREEGKAISEGLRRRKDGSTFWASVVITALHDPDGGIMGYSKVTRDLTERKRSDDALQKNALDLQIKNRELEKLNAELASFAYVVSHDLKEPIRKIQVFAGRQLEPDKSPEQIKQLAEKIIFSASRMQTLMESLLSYSKLSTGPDASTIEMVDLNEIRSLAENDLELAIGEKGAVIHSQQLPTVKGISFQLHQLFLNLLSNSLKFTPAGRSPVISISCEQVKADMAGDALDTNRFYHRIKFSDNGVGFEPEQSTKIFDMFKRITPKIDVQGTGIGLAIVKKVAQNHNGWVVAEATPGVGADFYVYLPAN